MSNNPSSLSRLPVWILLFVTAIGVPTAAGLAFAEQVTQNPWQAMGLALLYELLVLMVSIITGLWQRLESRWLDRLADWLDNKVQNLAPGYRKRYLQHLIYRHRDFDVKGLTTQGIYSLELEKVFVELSIAPRPAHQISTDPIRSVSKELRAGNHLIWDYLKSKQMAGQNLAILGLPGSGKTTLLKHVTLTLATGKKYRRRAQAPNKLPILLFLRDHAEAIKDNPDLSLAQVIQNSLAKWDRQAPSGWFESHLTKGRCLVMFDGLDEVADLETRRQVVAWVERQMVVHARNRFILTSRPFGYRSNPLGGVTVLEVRPFSSEQVQRFVHNWI